MRYLGSSSAGGGVGGRFGIFQHLRTDPKRNERPGGFNGGDLSWMEERERSGQVA